MNPSSPNLYRDTHGAVVSTELIFVALLALLGLIAGTVSVRDAVVAELADIAGMGQDLTQSFSYSGTVNHSASVAGSSVTDETDFCDSPEDIAGASDNCIVFDSLPLNEGETVSSFARVLSFTFEDGNANDTSTSGEDNSGTIVGDPVFDNGEVTFDGDDKINVASTPDINLGIHGTRTIVIDFTPDDVTSRQVIYEEGGGTRGLNIYLVDGELYFGGWNIPDGESGWDPAYLSTPVTAGTNYSVALVLDGGPTVEPGALTAYVNGVSIGSVAGSQLWQHGGGIGFGGINGRTIFHDIGAVTSDATDSCFMGSIQNVDFYDRALTATEVSNL